MIGNISKSKGFKGDPGPLGPQGPQGEQGIQGEKGDSPAIVLRLDDAGNLYYNSDGILVDKEYVESQNLVTKDEMKDYIDEEVEIIKSDVEGLQHQLNEEAHFRGYLSTNAKIQALEATPNDFAYSAESGTKWVYDVENGWQDTGTPVPDQLTPASDATPLINGTASAGTANEYARGDHRHPTDTTRVSVEEFNKFKIENAEKWDKLVEGELTEGGVAEIVTSIPVDLTQFKQLQFFAEVKVAEVASGTSCVHWLTISDKSHATYNIGLLRHTVTSKGEVDYTWCCDTDIHRRADDKYAFWSKFLISATEGNNGITDLRTMISSQTESNLTSTTFLKPHLILRVTNTTFEVGTKFVLRGVR